MSLECSIDGCHFDAARALVNKFGWMHLECEMHRGSSAGRGSKLVQVPEEALKYVRPLGKLVHEFMEVKSDTVEIPMNLALALYVMHG